MWLVATDIFRNMHTLKHTATQNFAWWLKENRSCTHRTGFCEFSSHVSRNHHKLIFTNIKISDLMHKMSQVHIASIYNHIKSIDNSNPFEYIIDFLLFLRMWRD